MPFVSISLVFELLDSISKDVALCESNLVNVDKHFKLLEVEKESLILVLNLFAKCLNFVEVHVSNIGVEVTLELSTDVSYSLTRLGAQVTRVLELLGLGIELCVKSGIRFSQSLETISFVFIITVPSSEFPHEGRFSCKFHVSISEVFILSVDFVEEVFGKIFSHVFHIL